jgi:ABC-type nitrate/sulfonate/bicarbonate transport system substrate-binding protein
MIRTSCHVADDVNNVTIRSQPIGRCRDWCSRIARLSRRLGLAAVMGVSAMSASAAQMARPIEVVVFPGGFNWPIWVAQQKGFFARNDVDVKLTPTPNSEVQLTGLINAKFDVAMTAMDNIIAYVEGQVGTPTAQNPDLIAFMGSDNGFLRLVTVPEVKTYADLKGQQLSVDALTTGYAFVLRKLLEKGGLQRDNYQLLSAGGVQQRFEALMEKKHAGTLLVSPFEVAAEARGFNRLADAVDVLGHYQGVVGATRRGWAREHQDELIGFIRGYRSALAWLYNSGNDAQAVAILRRNLPSMSEAMAEKSREILLHPTLGFTRDASLDLEGIRTILALRSEYAEPRRELGEPEKYYDLSYGERARGPN